MKAIILLSLLSIASSLATPPQQEKWWLFEDSRWLMWNFTHTGDPVTGKSLHFNMTSDQTSSEPAVSADCLVRREEPYWQPCSMLIAKSADWNRGVWVMPLPTTDTINLKIMHAFTSASNYSYSFYNLTGEYHGNWQGVTFPVNPMVRPTEADWITWISDTGEEGNEGHIGC